MKNLLRRPHFLAIWLQTSQPHECLSSVRDQEYQIEANIPIDLFRREPQVIDICGDFDSFGNIQQDMESSRINFKLIR